MDIYSNYFLSFDHRSLSISLARRPGERKGRSLLLLPSTIRLILWDLTLRKVLGGHVGWLSLWLGRLLRIHDGLDGVLLLVMRASLAARGILFATATKLLSQPPMCWPTSFATLSMEKKALPGTDVVPAGYRLPAICARPARHLSGLCCSSGQVAFKGKNER